MREENQRLREALGLALGAWDAIEWMAAEYAESGSGGGPEMRGYKEAAGDIIQARAALRETP